MSDEAPAADATVRVTVADGGPPLRPAEPDDVLQALAFALRYRGRRRVDTAGEVMARITAERIAEHLARSGFVVMKKPPAPLHGG